MNLTLELDHSDILEFPKILELLSTKLKKSRISGFAESAANPDEEDGDAIAAEVPKKKPAKAKEENTVVETLQPAPVEPEVTEELTLTDLREALLACAGRLNAKKAKAILIETTGVDNTKAVDPAKYADTIAALNAA